MINGYSSKNLRNLTISTIICLLFLSVNTLAKEFVITKMVDSLSKSITAGPIINQLIEKALVVYDYSLLYGHK